MKNLSELYVLRMFSQKYIISDKPRISFYEYF